MFDILSQLIVSALAKLLGTSTDIATKEITWRRSLLAALVHLFDSLVELETAAGRALSLFERYANGAGDVTKVVVRDRLGRVTHALTGFAAALRKVESMLSIYDHDLLLRLRGAGSRKAAVLASVDLILEVSPNSVKYGDKVTSLVSYPTRLPDLSDLGAKHYPLRGAELHKQAESLKKSLAEQFNRRVVDLSFPVEAKIALEGAQENLKAIQLARQELANFIKTNLPLETLLR